MRQKLNVLAVFLGFSAVFAIGCMLVRYFPEPWFYLFGAGLVLGAVAAGDYKGQGTRRLPVLLCFAVGMISSPVILAYPVVEILGMYVAIAILILGSTWWWESLPLASE
jgi:hypothetical protein